MKTTNVIKLLFISILVIAFSSCSNDDDGGNGGSAAAGTVTAKIDGTNFTSLEIASVANLVSGVGTLTIQGNDADGKAIVIVINGYEGPGSYDIGGNNLVAVVASYVEADINNPMNSQTWQAPFDDTVAGTVSISEETDDNVKGTFSYTAKNSNDNSTKEITDGSFNLTKQTN